MGIWSKTLFVTVYPGKPDDYFIDTTKLYDATFYDLRRGGFFNKHYHSPTKSFIRPRFYTLSQFMDTKYDMHKIIGHFSDRVINMWLDLFKHILKENPALEEAQFHFFCKDTHEPYYILLNRSIISEAPNTIYLYTGQSESRYYFTERPFSWFRRYRSDEWPFVFNLHLYMKNWEKAYFKHTRLQITSV